MNNSSTTKFHILSHPISASQPSLHGPDAAPEPAAAPASENNGPSAGGGARRGRPTVYSDKVFAMMKDYARRLGFSDTAAAEGVGVSSSTISRWKKECPEIAHELQTARQECRAHHLERMMQFAEGDDNRGLRATMWLLERLYPGDYAPRMSERFAYMNLEDRRRDREEQAAYEEWLRERRADQKTPATPAAAPVEPEPRTSASQTDSHNSRNASDPLPADEPELGEAAPAEHSHSTSEDDSHNSRNPGAAEPAADSDAYAHPSRQAATAAKRQQAAAVQGVAGGHVEEMHFSSEGDSHNSRNSSPATGSGPAGPLVPAASDGAHEPTERKAVARSGSSDSLNEAAPAEASFTTSVSDSHNSRNSPSASVDFACVPGGLTAF